MGEPPSPARRVRRWLARLARLVLLLVVAFVLGSAGWVAYYSVVNPGTTGLMAQERDRLGFMHQHWRALEDIPISVRRAAIAAEDANFCAHWGVDVAALRGAVRQFEEGGPLIGASTITQQTAKNVFLWPERSFFRKAAEFWFTGLIELFWSKRRTMEVYLNVAEFGEGAFGVEAGAQQAFGRGVDTVSAAEAALLVGTLPSPRRRRAGAPNAELRARADRIVTGAALIAQQDRDACVRD